MSPPKVFNQQDSSTIQIVAGLPDNHTNQIPDNPPRIGQLQEDTIPVANTNGTLVPYNPQDAPKAAASKN
ncbi:295_t:CDS:2 [Paraglomus occultum]|uniref:295_t:CDS:1 n=1 Tax=Paraglomus occultum TaxID=144539 RepID=A0A9N9BBP2_9GLOM|nr:295_t:CDS:2 [Paraglomus occultum]